MTWDGTFDDLMADSVAWRAASGYGAGGSRTLDSAKTVLCRIEQGTRRVRDAHGREVVSQTLLFARPACTDGSAFTPSLDDELSLPAEYSPRKPPILRLDRINDEDGVHHWEIYL